MPKFPCDTVSRTSNYNSCLLGEYQIFKAHNVAGYLFKECKKTYYKNI